MAKPRVLFVTRNFPPLTGGMERLALHTLRELENNYTCGLVGPSGSRAFVNTSLQTAECTLNPLSRFLIEAWLKAMRLARNHPPDLLLAGSGLTAPITTRLAKRSKAKTMTWLHGLDIVAANPVYQAIFFPAIEKSDIIIANSRNTALLAEKAGVADHKIRVLHPGVDVKVTGRKPGDFRQIYDLKGKKVLLSVGRLIRRKGLREFIQHALPNIISRLPSTVLVIIGGEATQALKKGRSVLADLKKTAASAGVNEHIRYLGKVDENILNSAYNEADTFVLPVLDLPDDVEGFGMVAVEAAAHGLPTAGFAAGGVPDAVAHGRSGLLVAPGDYNALANTIARLLNEKESTGISVTSCREHARRFSWSRYGDSLREIVREAVQ